MDSFFPIEVKPLESYRLIITFDNEEQRIFDVAPYLNDDYFAPLRNPAIFKTVRVTPLTVEWAGGIDICPDELYYNSKPVVRIQAGDRLLPEPHEDGFFIKNQKTYLP